MGLILLSPGRVSVFEPCLVVKNIISKGASFPLSFHLVAHELLSGSWCLYRKHVIKADDKKNLLRVWGPSRFNPRPFPVFSVNGLVGLQEQSAAPGVSPSSSEILFFFVVLKPGDSVNALKRETLSSWVHDTVSRCKSSSNASCSEIHWPFLHKWRNFKECYNDHNLSELQEGAGNMHCLVFLSDFVYFSSTNKNKHS